MSHLSYFEKLAPGEVPKQVNAGAGIIQQRALLAAAWNSIWGEMLSIIRNFANDEPILIDGDTGEKIYRAEIRAIQAFLAENLETSALAFLFCRNDIGTLSRFHALFESRIPVVLIDANLGIELLRFLISTYRPSTLVGMVPLELTEGYKSVSGWCWVSIDPSTSTATHRELAVLLTTSGSTGSPKLVRLSRENVISNARAIADSLSITKKDLGISALPAFYSFGMSVVTSHAEVGSPVLVTSKSVLDSEFWSHVRHWGVTLLPGVPQTYRMLKRLRFIDRELNRIPSLRGLMQAGGRLDDELVDEFRIAMSKRRGGFYVMYGQTEASPRISCVPPNRLVDKVGSVGIPLSGGALEIHGDDGPLGPGDIGEVVYSGPNVMMGYALSSRDLSLGDTQGNRLRTGDLGYLDSEGFLFLTGRLSRVAKISGRRFSLDEVEAMAQNIGTVAAVEGPNETLVLFTTSQSSTGSATRLLREKLRLAPKNFSLRILQELPTLSNGKTNYPLLSELAKEN